MVTISAAGLVIGNLIGSMLGRQANWTGVAVMVFLGSLFGLSPHSRARFWKTSESTQAGHARRA